MGNTQFYNSKEPQEAIEWYRKLNKRARRRVDVDFKISMIRALPDLKKREGLTESNSIILAGFLAKKFNLEDICDLYAMFLIGKKKGEKIEFKDLYNQLKKVPPSS